MQFTINLATRAYVDHRLVNRILIVCSIMLILLLVWNANALYRGMGELERLRAGIASYESKLNSLPAGVSEQEYSRMKSSIRFFNGIIIRKTKDWGGLLHKLENATPEGIVLTSVAPYSKSGEMKIEGKTHTFARVRSYLEKLEDSRSFANIQLLMHRDDSVKEKGNGVQFTISCRVVPQ